MSTAKKIKIAQIGIGHDHALPTFRSLLKQKDIFDVVGLYVPETERGRKEEQYKEFAEAPKMTLEQLLDYPGLDAVSIESDDWNLTKYSLLAAEKGLHIHMDKPGGVSQSEYEKLLSLIKRNGTVFQTGYMYRYNPAYLEAKRLAESGELGEIYSVEAHMDCLHLPEKREWLAHFDGGMMYFLGCHLVDLILLFQGIPEQVVALNSVSGFDDVKAEDIGFAAFKYPHGVSFAKTSACEPGGFMRRQLVICGSKKTLHILPLERYLNSNPGDTLETDMRICDGVEGWKDSGTVKHFEPFDRYDSMMADFARFVRKEAENPYSLEYEARLHRLILAACGTDSDYKGDIKL